jgi:hypothetical protein
MRVEDQTNLTDEELRIVPVSGAGFAPCNNAKALVAAASIFMLVHRPPKHPKTNTGLSRCWIGSRVLRLKTTHLWHERRLMAHKQ